MATTAQSTTEGIEQAVISWMQGNALPLQHLEAGNGFDDLLPLHTILQDVKVVGLGETTHGTREIFQLKHRLLEFLVSEMGFTVFTIEASYAACQAINDYIFHGKGDLAGALAAQWYVVWDTEEIAAMLAWMRSYNEGVDDEKKVKFLGVDITRNGNGREFVLKYLGRVAPEQVAIAATAFEILGGEETRAPVGSVDAEGQARLVEVAPHFQALLDFLTSNRDDLVNKSSLQEFEQAWLYTRIMQQWLTRSTDALRSPAWDRGDARSNYMAENFIYLTDKAAPDAKFIIWQHNAHLRVINPDRETTILGSRLREKFGSRFYTFAFEFFRGSFQTRVLMPGAILGDLQEVQLSSSPPHSLAWYLAQTNHPLFMLDLRTPPDNPLVTEWLEAPQPIHHVGWVFDAKAVDYLEMRPPNEYDGYIFINSTTATHPTASARRAVENRDGL